MSHHHKNIERKTQNAVDTAPDSVFDNLALEIRHAGEVSADARLEQTEGPEEETFHLQHRPERQAAADDENHGHQHIGDALDGVHLGLGLVYG